MIKQSFLNSLVGLTLNKVKILIRDMNYNFAGFVEGMLAPMVVKPNTILVWHKNGKVTKARCGDGIELEKDI